MGEKNHINKIPPKSRDNPVNILFSGFFLYVFFFRSQQKSRKTNRLSDFSSRPWQKSLGDPQTSPQHADPHEFLVCFSLKRPQVHVDRRVVGWSAGRHVDHPCG